MVSSHAFDGEPAWVVPNAQYEMNNSAMAKGNKNICFCRDKRLRAEKVLLEPACFLPSKEDWTWMVSSKRANEVK